MLAHVLDVTNGWRSLEQIQCVRQAVPKVCSLLWAVIVLTLPCLLSYSMAVNEETFRDDLIIFISDGTSLRVEIFENNIFVLASAQFFQCYLSIQ